MPRILLIHWHAGEAAERAERLRRAGFEPVLPDLSAGGAALKVATAQPPDAAVIDLGRLPAQGRDAGVWLRKQKATRQVPLVFVAGDAAKVARVRELLPDAIYAGWDGIGATLRRALESPPADPVTPGLLAGYSGTPLPKKLGIKAGSAVALLGAPEGFEETLGALPKGVRLRRQARGPADVVLLFAHSVRELERRFPAATRCLANGGRLWIVWPKKASGVATDLTQPTVRSFGLERGFVDYKICAVDATFSGLCFARRTGG